MERYDIQLIGRIGNGSWVLLVAPFDGEDWLQDLWDTLNVSTRIEDGKMVLSAGPHPQRVVARWSLRQFQQEHEAQERESNT